MVFKKSDRVICVDTFMYPEFKKNSVYTVDHCFINSINKSEYIVISDCLDVAYNSSFFISAVKFEREMKLKKIENHDK